MERACKSERRGRDKNPSVWEIGGMEDRVRALQLWWPGLCEFERDFQLPGFIQKKGMEACMPDGGGAGRPGEEHV